MEVINFKEIVGRPAARLDFKYNEKIINLIKGNIPASDRMFNKDHWIIHKKQISPFVEIVKKNGISIRLSPLIQSVLRLNAIGLNESEALKMSHYKRHNPSYRIKTVMDTSYLGMKLDIYDSQKSSLDYAIKRNGRVLIADDMGIGKTAQAIAIALHYRSDFPVVILAQASLLYNWKKEFLKFTNIDEREITILSGKKKIKGSILIVSYDYAHKNNRRLSQYLGVKGIVIIDEAHNIKNKDANKTPSIMELSSIAKRCIVMTGTPMLSRPVESWSLLKCVHPKYYVWEDYHKFCERYCEGHLKKIKTYDKNGKERIRKIYYNSGASNILEYHNKIRDSVMIRRLKSDKGMLDDLPEMQRFTQHFELNDKSFNALDSIIIKIRDFIAENYQSCNNNRSLLKSMIYGHLGEDGKKHILEAYRFSGISKIGAINEWVENWLESDDYDGTEDSSVDIEGGTKSGRGKLIIFGHHKEFISAIEENLKKLQKTRPFKFVKIDSDSGSLEKRFQLGEDFQDDPSIRISLISIKVGSVGLTLTEASDILMGEMPWTPAIALQAECRAFRNGQKNKVSVYYPIADNKIDGVLWNLISFKSVLSSAMIDGGLGDEMETSFNTDDLVDNLIISEINEFYDSINNEAAE